MDNTSRRILIVEDDQFLRDFYQELLTAEGYQIDTASDGDMAIAKISQGGWDLVLLDIMLPKKDGLQILQEIKTNPPKSKIGPIVVLTNLGHDTVINKAFALGASGYLVKSSLSPEDVLKEVTTFLQKT